jgi:hypothetical protein
MRFYFTSALLSLSLLAPLTASAQEASTTPLFTPRGVSDNPGAPRDAGPESKSGDNFHPLALTLNPLSLLLGRIGANVEYLPAKHHAIMLNPYMSSAKVESSDVKTSFSSYGAELGYHFYTGNKGANGFYVGPSVLVVRTTAKDECINGACSAAADVDFLTYGAALDFGGQYVSDGGFTIGGGAGAMYLRSSASADGSKTMKFEGFVPRVLFTVGYSI